MEEQFFASEVLPSETHYEEHLVKDIFVANLAQENYDRLISTCSILGVKPALQVIARDTNKGDFIQTIESRPLNFLVWRPFEQPIFFVPPEARGIAYDLNCSAYPHHQVPLIRLASPYKVVSMDVVDPISASFSRRSELRLPRFFDIVEAIYFHDVIPREVTLRSSRDFIKVKPTSRYLFIGFAFTESTCQLYLNFEEDPAGPPFGDFTLIGWMASANLITQAIRTTGLKTTWGDDKVSCINMTGITMWDRVDPEQ
jgi:hypothetical protein